jgi:sec-independent protein translocase protein TatA
VSEWIIVAIVGVVLLFSAKKLPDMARGLGQSMRIFKAETRGLKEDDARAEPKPVAPAETPAPVRETVPDEARRSE